MLVPNSTNLSAVVNHISSKDWSTQVNVYEKRKSHSSHSVRIYFDFKDLYEAGKILRTKLRRVGEYTM